MQPGDTVAVVGVGGIGANAIQGAKLAGAARRGAIDPVEFKREKAMEFGATHTHASMDEALAALPETTWNRGFDKVIMTMGVGSGEVLGQAFWLAAKRGKIVVTNIHPTVETSIAIPAAFLTFFEKQLVGSLFGSAQPACRHPEPDRALHPGSARPRRSGHPHLHPRRRQRRLRRHAGRQEHPRGSRLRPLTLPGSGGDDSAGDGLVGDDVALHVLLWAGNRRGGGGL